jgi:hypothetical protein
MSHLVKIFGSGFTTPVFLNYINPTLKEGKNVKSQDSPVPRNASDMTGGHDSRAPNTA